MSNQWGRDSQVPSGGGGIGRTVVAVLVALSLGAAASYGYLRYVRSDISPQLVALGEETQTLRTALTDAQTRLGRSDQALAEANAALAKAETTLNQLQSAETVRDPEIANLRRRLAAQSSELDALSERLAASSEAQATSQQIQKQHNAEMDQLRNQMQEAQQRAGASEAEKRKLEVQLAELSSSQERSVSASDRELAGLKQDVIPELTAKVQRLEQQAGTLTTQKADLQTLFEAAQARAEADQKARGELDAQLRDARDRIAGLERQLAAQTAVAPTTPTKPTGKTPAAAEAPKPVPQPPAAPAQPARPPRNALQVDSALNRAPGLSSLTDEKAAQLKSALLAGACVTTALEGVFDRVPVIALRNLIRDLKSDC